MTIPNPIPQDIYFRQQMEEGSAKLLARMMGAPNSSAKELIWSVPFQGKGYEPGTEKWRERQRLLRAIQENETRIESQRVNRDPCPRCNTRRDIGCKHFPRGGA